MESEQRRSKYSIRAVAGPLTDVERSEFYLRDVERLFSASAEDGQVQLPLTKTFFCRLFGMITDRFSISWMIQAAQDEKI